MLLLLRAHNLLLSLSIVPSLGVAATGTPPSITQKKKNERKTEKKNISSPLSIKNGCACRSEKEKEHASGARASLLAIIFGKKQTDRAGQGEGRRRAMNLKASL